MREIKNAKIIKTFLGKEDHGIPTCYLQLDYDGSSQSFGGWDLRFPAYGIDFIMSILKTLEIESWEKLNGVFCRVDAGKGKVFGIGNIVKDIWFYPEGRD